jgi:hypothetical protein
MELNKDRKNTVRLTLECLVLLSFYYNLENKFKFLMIQKNVLPAAFDAIAA